MPNPICHFEFASEDPARLQDFYSAIFDWSFTPSSMPGYTLIGTGAEPGGGLMARTPEMPHNFLTTYILVDDIEATMAQVIEHGGEVIVPKMPIPHVGEFGVFRDPDGNCLGIYRFLQV